MRITHMLQLWSRLRQPQKENDDDGTDQQQEKDQPKLDLDQVAKVSGFGYNLTTLNKNYNPRATDESWVCVFCLKSFGTC